MEEEKKNPEEEKLKANPQEFETPVGPPADQGELDFLIEMFWTEDDLLTRDNIRTVYDQQGFENAFQTLEEW